MSFLDEELPIENDEEDEDEKTRYVFTREVRRWGVEAGDDYNPERHQIVGGTEKLLQDGTIEDESTYGID